MHAIDQGLGRVSATLVSHLGSWIELHCELEALQWYDGEQDKNGETQTNGKEEEKRECVISFIPLVEVVGWQDLTTTRIRFTRKTKPAISYRRLISFAEHMNYHIIYWIIVLIRSINFLNMQFYGFSSKCFIIFIVKLKHFVFTWAGNLEWDKTTKVNRFFFFYKYNNESRDANQFGQRYQKNESIFLVFFINTVTNREIRISGACESQCPSCSGNGLFRVEGKNRMHHSSDCGPFGGSDPCRQWIRSRTGPGANRRDGTYRWAERPASWFGRGRWRYWPKRRGKQRQNRMRFNASSTRGRRRVRRRSGFGPTPPPATSFNSKRRRGRVRRNK